MVLSGAAIFAVYVAGYARTQAAADLWQTSPAQLSPSAATGATSGTGAPATAGGAATGGGASAASNPGVSGVSGAANCTASGTSAIVIPPPVATYRDGEGRGDDDGRRGRYREQEGGRSAGYFPATRAQTQTQCPPGSNPASGQQAAPGAGAQAQGQGQAAGATTSPATNPSSQGQPAAAATAASSPYKDGVYSGTGWSRHGSVSVALTVKGGKMTSIVVTGCTTHYPCADVSPMPGEVLAAQSLQVDTVSGATDSSLAFLGAVQQALGAAQAAKG